ncbi:patatin-like phospholipase family protein [Niabella drilacis]|uniref:Predicted acylesterase/phospholipase RssA, contains patatin domain n=1 Tax=Niabella drilacis (strain DSM 25811 / CCM 8410 / CCUG 62505 / LMG 26954 / E90) TaxID=1285928 RepID=A0A1G6MZ10_NIADE|nr:patatin-like phospholipase family protein [Niabella drilacis]SDC60773.1 Predicted acylesterase/phospholipase RssA, contains patatin domain [Niabella drilacis]
MKRALIISGGGSKGAFAVGVIKDLETTYRLSFDTVIGTSTGALIAPLAALKRLDVLEALYTSVTTEDLLEAQDLGASIWNGNSLNTANGLGSRVRQIYTDDFYNQLLASTAKVYLTTTCLQSQELVVYTTDPAPAAGTYYRVEKIKSAEQFRRAVMASASQPVFMPPVRINIDLPGAINPGFQYVDGGTREYVGVGIALEAGAQELFTILLSPRQNAPDPTTYKGLLAILLQTVSVFITDVADNDLFAPRQYIHFINYINQVKTAMKADGIPDAALERYFNSTNPDYQNLIHRSPVKLHIIQPDTALEGGPGGLVFKPDKMQQMIQLGQIALQNYVAHLKPGETDWA